MVVEEEREAAAMLVACERQKARQANVSLFLEQVEGDARDRLRAVSEVYAVKFRQMAAEEATRQEEARLEAEALNGAAVSIQKVERGRTGTREAARLKAEAEARARAAAKRSGRSKRR